MTFNSLQQLQIVPATATADTLSPGNLITFSARGGTEPYTYRIVSGGGLIDAASGIYQAPQAQGAVQIEVSDALANKSDALVRIQPVSAPQSLNYPSSSFTFVVGKTVSAVQPVVTGGTFPIAYSISPAILPAGLSFDSATGILSGTPTAAAAAAAYKVTVSNVWGAATTQLQLAVNAALLLTPATKTLAPGGSATFVASGGAPPYTFALTGIGAVTQAGLYTAPATAGTATLTVTDSSGMATSATLTITDGLVISPATEILAVNNPYTFTATGGTAPYVYSVSAGGGTINSKSGAYVAPAAAGSATVTVTDSLGSVSRSAVTINGALAIAPAAQSVAAKSSFAFGASGGVPPYTFTSNGGTIVATSGVFTAPAAVGTATVVVSDSFGNTSSAVVTINAALAISPSAKTVAPSGTVAFSATGGVAPYKFSVTGGGTIIATTGAYTASATAGSATVTVTDSLANTSTATVTINGALAINPATQTLAVGNSFNFTATGGVPPYAYAVTGGGAINATTGAYTAPATAGNVTVTVTDSLANKSSAAVTINAALTISPTTRTLSVGNSLTFTASGGVAPYTYSATGGGTIDPLSGAYVAPAAAGTATIKVMDSLGNSSYSTVTINAALAIAPATKSLAASSSFTFTATGGVAPYAYSVTGGGTIASTTGVYSAPAAVGAATVVVSDSLGNKSSSSVTITAGLAITPATVSLAVTNLFTFSATGGVSPYTYSLASGTGTVVPTTGVYTAPAPAGTATVRVTDAAGSTSSAVVTVNASLAITPATKTLAVKNALTFAATGGVAPYTFSVSAGTGTIVGTSGVYTAPAAAGTATVQVMDSLGNRSSAAVTINAALAIAPAAQNLTILKTFTFTATGGVAPYTYSIAAGGTGTIVAASGLYTAPLLPGTATVVVTDSLLNTSSAAVTVGAGVALSPAIKTLAVNNTFTFTTTGGVAPYTYSVTGGGTINATSGLYTAPAAAGTATITVKGGLTVTTSTAKVTINPALAITPLTKSMAVNGSFTFSATGGVAPYTYSVSSGTGTIVAATGVYKAPAAAGTASILVTDSLGNKSSLATVTVSGPVTISLAAGGVAVGSTTTFSATGGVSPYTFSISAGTGTIVAATGAYTAPTTPGTVTLKVTDSAGAIGTTSVAIHAGAPTKLAFTAGLGSLATASCSASGYTVQAEDVYANPAPFTGTVTLSGNGSGAFYSASGCGTVTTSLVFAAAATQTFYFQDSSAEALVLSAAATGLTSGTYNVTVVSSLMAPSGLTYLTNPANYTQHRVIIPNTPSNSGGAVSSYSIAPTLPAGLSFNTQTGAISGIPTVVSAATAYVVTATNSVGSTTAVLPVAVAANALTQFTPFVYLMPGQAVSFAPAGGTAPYTFAILTPGATRGSLAGASYVAPSAPVGSNVDIVEVTDSSAPPLKSDAQITTLQWTTLAATAPATPTARDSAAAVWTGSKMIIWGGQSGAAGASAITTGYNDGGIFDPVTASWTPITTTGAPSARVGHTLVSLPGSFMVWGGMDPVTGTATNTGGIYNLAAGIWLATNATGAPSARYNHTAVFDGTQYVGIYGGQSGSPNALAADVFAQYNVTTGAWTSNIATGAMPNASRTSHSAVFTGSRMIIWGGAGHPTPVSTLNDGGQFVLGATPGFVSATSTLGAVPTARADHAAVWTGQYMAVWGGASANGGLYDPAADSWTAITAGPLSGRTGFALVTDASAVTNADHLYVWGGTNGSAFYSDGASLDLASCATTCAWTAMPSSGLTARAGQSAVWAGTGMVIWGGASGTTWNQDGALLH